MLHELRRRGGRYRLETMCIGGGQGLMPSVERPRGWRNRPPLTQSGVRHHKMMQCETVISPVSSREQRLRCRSVGGSPIGCHQRIRVYFPGAPGVRHEVNCLVPN
jgi:hypothetical protein